MVGLGWAEARRVSTGSEAVAPAAARRNARRSTLVGVWSMAPPLRGAMRAWNDRAPRNTTTRPPIEAGATIASASMAVNIRPRRRARIPPPPPPPLPPAGGGGEKTPTPPLNRPPPGQDGAPPGGAEARRPQPPPHRPRTRVRGH